MVRRRKDEQGISTIEVVLVMPAVFIILMLVIQVALAAHARSVAQAAAQEGAADARHFDGSSAQAWTTTNKYLDDLGPRIVQHRNVNVQRTRNSATVTVTGTVMSLVPWIKLSIRETSSGPVERYVPPKAPR